MEDFQGDANAEIKASNKAKYVKNILPDGIDCVFVRQSEQLGLGHAILRAEKVVGSEPFAVILADDFIPVIGHGVTKTLIERYYQSSAPQLAALRVPSSDISKYGVIGLDKDSLSPVVPI